MSLLAVQDLRKAFGGVHAVDGVDFALEAGEAVALIGANGAGKTTCFNLLAGQLKPDSGRILLDGVDIARLPPHAIWRRGIARTFQVAATFRSMRVRENIQVALMSRHRRTLALWRPAKTLFVAEAEALLHKVGMAGHADQPVSALAYADLKRLELAMALVNEPRLLLLDEPTAGVAAAERRALMDLVSGIVRERAIGVLFTEHDMDIVFGHGERVIVLHEGRVAAEGRPEEIRANPKVQEIYLGGDGTGERLPSHGTAG